MKSTILSLVIAVSALGIAANAQGQVIKAYTGTEKTIGAQDGQSVLTGAWKVATDPKGNLVISDAANTVVRVVAALEGTTAGYPVNLTVDKAGNLHIEDISGTSAHCLARTEPTAQGKNTWADPDMMEPATAQALKSLAQAH